MPPAAFLHPENAPKSLAAGASPQTTLGELTALPRPPSWIKGPTSKGKGGEGRGEEGRGEEGRIWERRDFGPSQCWRQIDVPEWLGCYIWYSKEGPGRAAAPPSPPPAVPNVTANPSTASVYQLHIVRCGTIIVCAV